MKIKYGKIIGALLFLSLFLFLFFVYLYLIRPMPASNQYAPIFLEDNNTIDVVFLGSSHIHTSVNPYVIWQETGIPCFAYSTSNQTTWGSYYLLDETLKTQSPKVVVVDVFDAIRKNEGYTADSTNFATIGSMSVGRQQIDYLAESLPPSANRIVYWSGLTFFHTGWASMNEANLLYNYSDYSVRLNKGYYSELTKYERIQPLDIDTSYPVTHTTERISEQHELYLEKLIALCQRSDMELIIVKTPMLSMFQDTAIANRLNYVQTLAEQHGVRYIDFNGLLDQIPLSQDTDYMDETHLNKYGAERFSLFLAQLLAEYPFLVDKRDWPEYQSWSDGAAAFSIYSHLTDLKYETDLTEYCKKIEELNDSLVIVTSVMSDAGMYNDIDLTALGVNSHFMENNSYIGIWDKSSGYHFEVQAEQYLQKDLLRSDFPINLEVISAGVQVGNTVSIKIDGAEHALRKKGLNFVVYSKEHGTVFDSFTVSYDNHTAIER